MYFLITIFQSDIEKYTVCIPESQTENAEDIENYIIEFSGDAYAGKDIIAERCIAISVEE